MIDKPYEQLVKRMHEVSVVTPQTMGSFTPLYRTIIPFFKHATWRPLILGSFAVTLFVYLLLGASVVIVVNILQHGF